MIRTTYAPIPVLAVFAMIATALAAAPPTPSVRTDPTGAACRDAVEELHHAGTTYVCHEAKVYVAADQVEAPVVAAAQFGGDLGDFEDRIEAALRSATGPVLIDARDLSGVQVSSDRIDVDRDDVTILLGEVTLRREGGGKVWQIDGDDVRIVGVGPATHTDCGASSLGPCLETTGANTFIARQKFTGNRGRPEQAGTLRLAGGRERPVVGARLVHVEVVDSGGNAIAGRYAHDVAISHARIVDPEASGIFCGGDGTCRDWTVEDSYLEGCTRQAIDGPDLAHACIKMSGDGAGSDARGFRIRYNTLRAFHNIGINAESLGADRSLMTDVEIVGNDVDKTGASAPWRGETIAVTASDVLIENNRLRASAGSCVIVYGSARNVVVRGNDIGDCSMNGVDRSHAGVELLARTSNEFDQPIDSDGIIRGVRIEDNVIGTYAEPNCSRPPVEGEPCTRPGIAIETRLVCDGGADAGRECDVDDDCAGAGACAASTRIDAVVIRRNEIRIPEREGRDVHVNEALPGSAKVTVVR